AQALGIVEPVKAPPTEEATEETAADEAGEGDEGERASSYPPMPPADRDHSVEVFEAGSWLYTERSWDSSLGRLFIKQLAAKDASEGARLVVIEVTNQGERD